MCYTSTMSMLVMMWMSDWLPVAATIVDVDVVVSVFVKFVILCKGSLTESWASFGELDVEDFVGEFSGAA